MGNPKIINALDYEQDRVQPLHDVLAGADLERGRQIIDDFVNLNKVLVEKRLIDKSFNIAKNFGLDAQGRVILMDLGELYSSQTAIERQIKDRAWAAHYVVKSIPEKLREYFVKKMDEGFVL